MKSLLQNEVKQCWLSLLHTEESSSAQLVTPFKSAAVGLPRAWVELTCVWQALVHCFPVGHNGGSTCEENTTFRRRQVKYKNRSKKRKLGIFKKGNRWSTDVVQTTLLVFSMNFRRWGPKGGKSTSAIIAYHQGCCLKQFNVTKIFVIIALNTKTFP